MPAGPEPVPEGRRVGQYALIKLLGSGGMGDVYLARHTELGRLVALKLLRLGADDDHGTAARRFLREARAVASLEHPNICTLYETGTDGGCHFIAMQYVEGETLAARLARAALEEADAIRIATALSRALAYAHSRAVVHRDVKPQNVMLQDNGGVKLLDFGLAKTNATMTSAALAETEAGLTRAGVVMGTWKYMAPEQMRGDAADARSDVYSLGLVLAEMVGRDSPLVPILTKATARDPLDRYQSGAEVAAAIDALQTHDEPTRGVPVARRRRTAIVAGVLLLAAVGPLLYRGSRRDQPPAAAPAPAAVQSMTYWLDVRPDPASAVAPYRSLGDETLNDGSRVRINVASERPGFLYVLTREGDDPAGPLALAYPVSTDPVAPTSGDATGWYGFAGGDGVDHLWIVWSAVAVPELDALRPLVNARDLGQIRDAQRAAAIRAWLDDREGRAVAEDRDARPVQARLTYSGSRVVHHVALRHGTGSSR